jgi:hypothetical protein
MVKKYLELLKNIYHDPKSPAGYGSIINLYKVAKKIEPKIKLEDVKFFLEGDRTYTLHRPRRIRFKRAKTIPSGLYTDIQCDLAQFEKFFRANRGYKYVLIAVCVLSKRIWAYPLKSKQYGDMEEAFDKLLSDIPITPARIFTDKGKEFILNKHIKYKENGKTITKTVNYFEEKGIEKYWSSTKTIKAALAERYIRVLKSRIYRYLSNNGTLKWFDVLDKIVVALNNTPSRITGMSAMDINFENAQTIWQKVYGKYFERRGENKKPRYLKGDNVRMSNYKEVFDRGFLPNWSDEILEVD